jgi:predicted transcriptional regulator
MYKKKDITDMHINEVMSTTVLTADENLGILNICSILNDSSVGSIVIIDDKRKPIGIVTERDIVKLIASRPPSLHIQAKDVMTKPVITVYESQLLRDAILLMNIKSIKRLVVLDSTEKLTGIITQTDILMILRTDLFSNSK